MKPIVIPRQTIEAYGAEEVEVSAPPEFEFTDGSRPESYLAMRVGHTVYTLVGIENQDELEALNRTKCFYLGFFGNAIPIFTVRVADIMYGEEEPEEQLPAISDNFDLHQEAKDSWDAIPNMETVCYKPVLTKSRFVQIVGKDDRHQDVFMSSIIYAGDFLLHNFMTGKTCVVSGDWLEFMYGKYEGWQEKTEDVSDPELSEPNDLGEEAAGM